VVEKGKLPDQETPVIMKIEIEVFNSLGDARGAWLEFQQNGGLTVFQTFQWQKNCEAHSELDSGTQTRIVTVRAEDGSPLLLFPLAVREKWGLRILEWLGDGLVDYGAPVIGCRALQDGLPEPFTDVWNRILALIAPLDIVWLKRIPRFVQDFPNPMAVPACDPYHTEGHFAKLTGDWDEFLKSRTGSRTRSTRRRKARRLDEMGEVSFQITDGSDTGVLKTASRAMVDQKRKRYIEIGAPDFLSHPGRAAFFTDPDPSLLQSGMLNVSCLRLDGRVITTHWGMVYRKRFYYYMPSFERGPWTAFSPGERLLEELFKWSFQRGVRIFDFTIGEESYKERWCDSSLELLQYFQAVSARGSAAAPLYSLYRSAIHSPSALKAARGAKRAFWRLRRAIKPR